MSSDSNFTENVKIIWDATDAMRSGDELIRKTDQMRDSANAAGEAFKNSMSAAMQAVNSTGIQVGYLNDQLSNTIRLLSQIENNDFIQGGGRPVVQYRDPTTGRYTRGSSGGGGNGIGGIGPDEVQNYESTSYDPNRLDAIWAQRAAQEARSNPVAGFGSTSSGINPTSSMFDTLPRGNYSPPSPLQDVNGLLAAFQQGGVTVDPSNNYSALRGAGYFGGSRALVPYEYGYQQGAGQPDLSQVDYLYSQYQNGQVGSGGALVPYGGSMGLGPFTGTNQTGYQAFSDEEWAAYSNTRMPPGGPQWQGGYGAYGPNMNGGGYGYAGGGPGGYGYNFNPPLGNPNIINNPPPPPPPPIPPQYNSPIGPQGVPSNFGAPYNVGPSPAGITGPFTEMNDQLARAAPRIIAFGLLFGAWRVGSEVIKGITQDVISLSDATAKLSFVRGVSEGAARSDLLQQSISGAQYGVNPQQAYAGAIIGSQFGSSPEAQQAAQQISLVFGQTENYNNIVQEVAQTMHRSNGEFSDTTRILDLLATLTGKASLSMEGYFDAIQSAIPLSHQLGLSIEQTAVLIAQTSAELERAPDQTAGLYSKLLQRAETPETQTKLARMGITGSSPIELITQAGKAESQFVQQGNVEAADQLAIILSGGGGAQARQDLIVLGQALSNFNKIQGETINTTGAWKELFGNVSDTIGADLKTLTTSAQSFVNVWANTGPVESFFEAIGKGMKGLSTTLDVWSKGALGQDTFAKLPEDKQLSLIDEFNQTLGNRMTKGDLAAQAIGIQPVGGGAGGAHRNIYTGEMTFQPTAGMIDQANDSGAGLMSPYAASEGLKAAFYAWLENKMNPAEVVAAAAGTNPHIAGSSYTVTPGGPFHAEPLLSPFGGIQDLPEGMTIEDIQSKSTGYEGTLSKQAAASGVDYAPAKETFFLFDKASNSFKAVVTTSDALALALKGAKDAANTFAGFQELPKGIPFDALQQNVATWTKRIQNFEPGTQDYEKPQTTAFWDAGAKVWKTITAPQDALRFAIEELTKQMQQITGVFNVPTGGEALVAFSALQAGFFPSDRVPGGGPKSGSPSLYGNDPNAVGEDSSPNYNHQNRGYRSGGAIPGLIAGDLGAIVHGVTPVAGRVRPGGVGAVGLSGQDAIDHLNANGATARGASPTTTAVTINTRNNIYLDSRLIAAQMNTSLYRSTDKASRSRGVNRAGAVLVG